jgi:tetratricopeptide (TPR) repeat protein
MEELIDNRPGDADLYYDLGVIYSESGRDDRALELMNRVLELDADHSSALNFVGYTWADQGERLDEAEQLIRRAIELRPDDGYITDSLGWVHYQRGLKLLAAGSADQARRSFGEAIEQLERALELLERDDPVITWHLGDAYRSVSRFDDAISAYRRALDLGPQDSDALRIRRTIELLELELQGDAPEAVN